MLDHAVAGSDAVSLSHNGMAVAEYVWQPDLPPEVAPRPYLHPVRTLGGTEVTELMPADHPHHLGVSIAVPDLAGHNFWGGRTYIRAQGPTHLDNHGTQRHGSWISRSPSTVVATLSWTDRDGVELLRERRWLSTVAVSQESWALDFAFELTNATAQPLSFASPATNGRPSAGYGGFFWRAPRTGHRVSVFGADSARGERTLHGRRTRWLALTGTGRGRSRWTLIFLPATPRTEADPWFVRTRDYPGVGSSLAWERPLLVAAGGTVRRRIVTVVHDGVLPAAQAGSLAEEAAKQVRPEACLW